MSDILINISKKNENHSFRLDGKVKFSKDTFIEDNEDYKLLLKGVCFNFISTDIKQNFNLFTNNYKAQGNEYFKSLRGNLAGAIYDKKRNEYNVFTNHIGDQKLYYTNTSDRIIISSNVFKIISILKASSHSVSLNKNAAYALLSYGYLDFDDTLFNEIKRIPAGHYIQINKDKHISLHKYFEISNTPNRKRNELDTIEELDSIFCKAIEEEYNKDVNYNFQHLSTLSGGLDCRMSNVIAKELGFKNITAFTFSNYGTLDMTIAEEIASSLDIEWIFKSLGAGSYLTQIDEMVNLTNAQVPYYGPAHSLSTFKLINTDKFGLIHTGQLGDVIIDTYTPRNAYQEPSPKGIKSTSTQLQHKVQLNLERYNNQELATFHIRGLNGILQGNNIYQTRSEAISPFLYPEFLSFCLSIPIEKRANHDIYKKWIIKKHPQAAHFKWESINAKITEKTIKLNGKRIPVSRLIPFVYKSIFYRLGIPIDGINSAKTMNPYKYWYKTNQDLSKNFDSYFNTYIDLIEDQELKKDCVTLYQNNGVIEKMQVLTLLSALKQSQ